jgi:hypothetical protein
MSQPCYTDSRAARCPTVLGSLDLAAEQRMQLVNVGSFASTNASA